MRPNISIALRAAVSLAMAGGFFGLGLALLSVLGLVVAWALVNGNAGAAILLIPLAAGALALVKGLRRGLGRLDREAPVGLSVSAHDQPVLLELVHDVARRVGTRAPDEVVITTDVNAAVNEHAVGPLSRDPKRRVLLIGLPLISCLRIDELKAVLAHELGHYAAGDTRLSEMTYRSYESMGRALAELRPGVFRRLLQAYAEQTFTVGQRVRRQQEERADIAAMRVAGKDAHMQALQKVALAAPIFDAVLATYVAPIWDAGMQPRNLYSAFRSVLSEPARNAEFAAYRTALLRSNGGTRSSHPSLSDRLSLARTTTHDIPAVEPDNTPARAFVRDIVTIEELLTERLTTAVLPTGPASVVDWPHVPERVLLPRFRSHAATMIEATDAVVGTTEVGMRHVIQTLARGGAEDMAFAVAGPFEHLTGRERTEAAHALLHPHLTSLVVSALCDHGHHLSTSWATGPILRRTADGAEVGTDEAVEQALHGDVSSLVELLTTAGVPPSWRLPSGTEPLTPLARVGEALYFVPNVHVSQTWRHFVGSHVVYDLAVSHEALHLIPAGSKRWFEDIRLTFDPSRAQRSCAKRLERLRGTPLADLLSATGAVTIPVADVARWQLAGEKRKWKLSVVLPGSPVVVRPVDDYAFPIDHVITALHPVVGSALEFTESAGTHQRD